MEAVLEARTCANCGVSVPQGYPRCPNCRALVRGAPVAASAADARRRRTSAPPSGTALAPAPRIGWWLGGGAAALSLIAAAALLTGDDEPAPTAGAAIEPELAVPEPAVRQALPRPALSSEPGPTPGGGVSQAIAVDELRRAFGKARLYSQLSLQGDQLELRSTSCDDPQLAQLLDQVIDRLKQSGLHRVRCLQPHGQVVFSRDL
jgi:hypothetical protein